MKTGKYNFNYGWEFSLANAFPLKAALDATKDAKGCYFCDKEYTSDWECVSLPHTFNDKDLFVNRIKDAGSGQLRTFSCYRKWFDIEPSDNQKVLLEIEGIRQTCYLYVNGEMAGYYEAGAFPIGFDITEFLIDGSKQLIAIATDNTSTRDLDYFSAETPNHPKAVPGSFVESFTVDEMPEGTMRGVSYEWNCNDFNPTVGGLSRNIYLHVKPKMHLTLPLYSNLKTKGTYIYASDLDVKEKKALLNVEAEVRNELSETVNASLKVSLFDINHKYLTEFTNADEMVKGVGTVSAFKTIIPQKAYELGENGFVPVSEDAYGDVECESVGTQVLTAKCDVSDVRFWDIDDPYLYYVKVELIVDGQVIDSNEQEFGFRKISYNGAEGLRLNDRIIWLTGYAQRATNEWAAIGCAPDWLKDVDAALIRESNANHIRFMHTAGSPADIRSFDRYGVVCTQPAGDKEREAFGRQWKQRVELMRDIIIYFRNNPSIFFWEAGNNSINKEHMREMRLLKEKLDPNGGRYMGCRTINTQDVLDEAEYVGTMLNRHAATFIASQLPITETEYLREESPRRVWDDFTPPFYDYDNLWVGKSGRKEVGFDCYDLTAEDFARRAAAGYEEFFHDRIGGASKRNLYSATAALCWTDSAQHGRQSHSENGRMSGRVDAVRVKKQSFRVFQVMQSPKADIAILGHWNYPQISPETYRYACKEFNGREWVKNGEYAYRNPLDKTVYVVGSYDVAKIDLFINGKIAGSCDKPENTFIFAFPHIDITQNGEISAVAYDYEGNKIAEDMIRTAGKPAKIAMSLHTGARGFVADGGDIAYIDIEILDAEGNLCPLCDSKIDFKTSGNVEFLGGYNSGRFKGPDKDDNVIHKPYVFAECGTNRVFLRSTKEPGDIVITATMHSGEETIASRAELKSISACTDACVDDFSQRKLPELAVAAPAIYDAFPAIQSADEAKYVKKPGLFCKVLVNGQEPNTNGNLSKVEHGSVYSPLLYILEAMHRSRPEAFSFTYENKVLTIISGANTVVAEVGRTHMLVNGEENLLNGQPFENEDDILFVEINAVIPYIEGVTAEYDERANLFRIEW